MEYPVPFAPGMNDDNCEHKRKSICQYKLGAELTTNSNCTIYTYNSIQKTSLDILSIAFTLLTLLLII